jgi:hypothetical protein
MNPVIVGVSIFCAAFVIFIAIAITWQHRNATKFNDEMAAKLSDITRREAAALRIAADAHKAQNANS